MNKEVDFLKQLVKIYSPYGKEEKISHLLVQKMKTFGFKAFKDKAGNVIGEVGQGKRQILFIGHMDVYQGKIPVRIKNNNLYGRGSVDAKGCLASFIMASCQLKNLKDKKIIIASCVEEEGPSSKGARFLMKNYDYKPEFVIIGEPSGWENITIAYKGILSFKLSFSQENFHYGSNGQRVTTKAILFCKDLINYLNHFKKENDFESPYVEIRSINSENDGLKEWCRVNIVLRIPPNFALQTLKNWLTQRSNRKIHFTQSDPAVVSSFNNPLVKTFRKIIKKYKGKAALCKKLGTSDMNIIAPFYKVPIIAYGPGDSKLDHTPNEHLNLKEYEKSIKILKEVLEVL